jgi:rod shape determining protein RodA
MAALLVPDYRRLERIAIPFYLLTLALLAAVLVFGPVVKGSQRWLVFGPVRMQPAELSKLALLLILARWLHRRPAAIELRLRDLLVPAALVAVPVLLVLREPDLGTALLLTLMAGSMLLFARIRTQSLLWLGASGVAAASSAWFFFLHDYQKRRVLTFLDPERDPLGAAYHAIQSQIAVGSGGLFGKGFLRGSQSQLDFLPEQQTDFVFSVLAEEWGFVGAALVLFLLLALLVRGIVIARASKDQFGTYLAIGVVAFLFWPAAINIGMVVGLAPPPSSTWTRRSCRRTPARSTCALCTTAGRSGSERSPRVSRPTSSTRSTCSTSSAGRAARWSSSAARASAR